VRVRRVVADLQPARAPGRGGAEGLAGPEVAGGARERALCELDPRPVPGPHPVGGGEQLDVDRQHAVVPDGDVVRRDRPRVEAADAVHDVAGDVVGVDVAEPHEHVRVLKLGADEDAGAHRGDHVDVPGQLRPGGHQHVVPLLDGAVVGLPAGRLQERPADGRCRVGRVGGEATGLDVGGPGVLGEPAAGAQEERGPGGRDRPLNRVEDGRARDSRVDRTVTRPPPAAGPPDPPSLDGIGPAGMGAGVTGMMRTASVVRAKRNEIVLSEGAGHDIGRRLA
jgi:hypothetical protein